MQLSSTGPSMEELMAAQSAIIRIQIQFNQQTGEMQLSGPLQNQVLMLGILAKAMQIVGAQPAAAGMPNGISRGLLVPS